MVLRPRRHFSTYDAPEKATGLLTHVLALIVCHERQRNRKSLGGIDADQAALKTDPRRLPASVRPM